jgi:single-strand DNA-binding protein
MNSLNSVLIEGNVLPSPGTDDGITCTFDGITYTFSIASERTYRKDDSILKEEAHFDIQADGKLGQMCFWKLRKGQGVRVVGRLAVKEAQVYILAEHVEIMPMKAKP